MTLLFKDTLIHRRPIMSLARSLSHDREALLQLLLEFCKNRTFSRIVRCPTYPVRVVTADLEDRKRLLRESIQSDTYGISHAFAILYESVVKEEVRKELGQYFTPLQVAERAITSIALKRNETVLDPGCGTGVFPLMMLKEFVEESENPASFGYLGIERDPILTLSTAISLDWVDAPSDWQVLYANYLDVKSKDLESILGEEKRINAIICNPPFVRSHRLGERGELTARLKLQAFSGLHSFFLEYSSRLVEGCRMIFVVPTEMNRTRYGTAQLERLESKFTLDSEVTYYDDRNHVWNSIASSDISLEMHTKTKHAWNLMLFRPILQNEKESQIMIKAATIEKETVPLCSFASVRRGISTGANHFFVITDKLAKQIGVSEERGYLSKVIPTKIPRTGLKRVFDIEDWNNLKEEDKPCWLLTLPKATSTDDLPSKVKQYISRGERQGIHLIPTCRSRTPWYHIKIPSIPDLFFTYISRGLPVFIYNKARVYNLTNLLGIYLKTHRTLSNDVMEQLIGLLNIELIKWVEQELAGRRYKGGFIKFEPRDLEKMPVSEYALNELRIGFESLSANYIRRDP